MARFRRPGRVSSVHAVVPELLLDTVRAANAPGAHARAPGAIEIGGRLRQPASASAVGYLCVAVPSSHSAPLGVRRRAARPRRGESRPEPSGTSYSALVDAIFRPKRHIRCIPIACRLLLTNVGASRRVGLSNLACAMPRMEERQTLAFASRSLRPPSSPPGWPIASLDSATGRRGAKEGGSPLGHR